MKSRKLSINIEALPEDLITNILHRLPFVTILVCTSVCKKWLLLIKNPTFISFHAKIINNNNRYMLFWKDESKFKLCYDDNNDTFHNYENKLRLPIVHYCDSVTTSICNGIICVAQNHHPHTFMLWNPAIRKKLNLPKPISLSPSTNNYYFQYIGSWFDFQINDYKLIRILCFFKEVKPTRVEIFSLMQNSWKTISSTTTPWFHCSSTSLPIFNGVLHWIVHFNRDLAYQSILGFDVNAEEFKTIELPSVCKANGSCFTLAIYKETSLMICGDFDNAEGEVWVMNEYGNVQSWAKIWKYQSMCLDGFTITSDNDPHIVGVLNDGKILWEIILAEEEMEDIFDFGMMLFSSDPTNGECMMIEYYKATSSYTRKGISYFEESLVLLDNANAISM